MIQTPNCCQPWNRPNENYSRFVVFLDKIKYVKIFKDQLFLKKRSYKGKKFILLMVFSIKRDCKGSSKSLALLLLDPILCWYDAWYSLVFICICINSKSFKQEKENLDGRHAATINKPPISIYYKKKKRN
jgi:hypothetical protein